MKIWLEWSVYTRLINSRVVFFPHLSANTSQSSNNSHPNAPQCSFVPLQCLSPFYPIAHKTDFIKQISSKAESSSSTSRIISSARPSMVMLCSGQIFVLLCKNEDIVKKLQWNLSILKKMRLLYLKA